MEIRGRGKSDHLDTRVILNNMIYKEKARKEGESPLRTL